MPAPTDSQEPGGGSGQPGLVLATPVFLNLPVLTGSHDGISSPAGLVFHPGVYVFSLVLVVLAAGLAAAARLAGRGPGKPAGGPPRAAGPERNLNERNGGR